MAQEYGRPTFLTRITLDVQMKAEDSEAADRLQHQLAARAAKAIKDGAVAPLVEIGGVVLYEGDPFHEPESPHIGPIAYGLKQH